MNQLHHFSDAAQTAAACCARLLDLLRAAIDERGIATLAVSGGSTPRLLFQEMAKATDFPWQHLRFFFVDERCVPPDSDQSNYRLARENFLDPAAFDPAHVFRVEGERPPEEAATVYIDKIREVFNLAPGALPVFDVIQLGMGPDGHTASLFPHGDWTGDRTHIATSVWVEKMGNHRVTLLPGVLLAARARLFLVAGPDKKPALEAVLNGPLDPNQYPAQILARDTVPVEWFIGG